MNEATPDPATGLADALAELAALQRAARTDRFRVRAYERAARVAGAAQAAGVDLGELDEGARRRLTGIGAAMASIIDEHAATGRIRMLEDLRAAEPPGVGRLLTVPLIGVRDARRLAGLGITDLEDLRDAAADDADADIDDRLRARLREGLRRVPAATDPRRPRPAAEREARELIDALSTAIADHSDHDPARDATTDAADLLHVAGALRRGTALIGGLDLVAVAPPHVVRSVAHASRAIPAVLGEAGDRLDVLGPSGHLLRLWSASPAGLGATLVAATGPEPHVDGLRARAADRGLELAPTGLSDGRGAVPTPTEAACYAALGLPWVPPELRERPGSAQEDAVPALVRAGHLRGDLHVHSDFSGDGVDPLEEMVRGAAGRGYDYVAITDHAENLTINGMPRETVLVRRRTIAEVQQRHPHVRVLDGAELNIDLEGGLDYDLDLLLAFDLCVASIHSHMDADVAAQTERTLAAIAHPAVHVIGHPTGRIIGRRPGYEIDLAAIAQAAAETGTALEVNGSPSRLDLDGPMVRAARAAGAQLSLSSDAHSVDELRYAEHAVGTARHGWAGVDDVLNARDLAGLLAFTSAKRQRA